MKEDSPRIINKQKGLAPGRLTRRFRRLKEAAVAPQVEAAADPSSEEPAASGAPAPCPEYFAPRDVPQTDHCWDPWNAQGRNPVSSWKISKSFWELVTGTGATIAEREPGVAWEEVAALLPAEEAEPPAPPVCPWSPDDLPAALRSRLLEISRAHDVPLFSMPDLEHQDLSPLKRLAKDAQASQDEENPSVVGGLVAALYLSPFWVRKPADFRPQRTGLKNTAVDLLEHLFVVHPVPPCLRNAWFEPQHSWEMPPLQWIAWFILAGQGASIHRARAVFGWQTSTQLLAQFAQVSADMKPAQGCVLAEIRRLGGDRQELLRLQGQPGYAFGPTEALAVDDGSTWAQWRREAASRRRDFWAATVRWLAKHRAALTDEMCETILLWALEEFMAGEDERQNRFSWSGRSPARAHEAANEYLASKAQPYPNMRWKGKGWNETWREDAEGEEEDTWNMRELLSGKELYLEGSAMWHCVGSYAMRCYEGQSAIFSMTHNGTRALTVEIEPESRRVVQARGHRNRLPTEPEQARLDRWQQRRLGTGM